MIRCRSFFYDLPSARNLIEQNDVVILRQTDALLLNWLSLPISYMHDSLRLCSR